MLIYCYGNNTANALLDCQIGLSAEKGAQRHHLKGPLIRSGESRCLAQRNPVPPAMQLARIPCRANAAKDKQFLKTH